MIYIVFGTSLGKVYLCQVSSLKEQPWKSPSWIGLRQISDSESCRSHAENQMGSESSGEEIGSNIATNIKTENLLLAHYLGFPRWGRGHEGVAPHPKISLNPHPLSSKPMPSHVVPSHKDEDPSPTPRPFKHKVPSRKWYLEKNPKK